MISEVTFSRGYSSFWQEYFPWINNYVQMINKEKLVRVYPPLDASEEPADRSINNIIAFTYFRNMTKSKSTTIQKAYDDAVPIIKKFPGNNLINYKYSKKDKEIILSQATRLHERYSSKCIVYPFFPGCGIMNNCTGDIYYNNRTLVEIKAGERNLQPSDLRQIIVYCGMNWLNKRDSIIIDELEVFNPRLGFLWMSKVNRIIESITELPIDECFNQMKNYLIELSSEFNI